jgi:hypothetical protein
MQPSTSNEPALAGLRQAPRSSAAELCDSLRYELIGEAMALAASYARSAAEAAWRGDQETLKVHIQQTRLSLLTAIEAFKALGGDGGAR